VRVENPSEQQHHQPSFITEPAIRNTARPVAETDSYIVPQATLRAFGRSGAHGCGMVRGRARPTPARGPTPAERRHPDPE
jgi:hypothetical protein